MIELALLQELKPIEDNVIDDNVIDDIVSWGNLQNSLFTTNGPTLYNFVFQRNIFSLKNRIYTQHKKVRVRVRVRSAVPALFFLGNPRFLRTFF